MYKRISPGFLGYCVRISVIFEGFRYKSDIFEIRVYLSKSNLTGTAGVQKFKNIVNLVFAREINMRSIKLV